MPPPRSDIPADAATPADTADFVTTFKRIRLLSTKVTWFRSMQRHRSGMSRRAAPNVPANRPAIGGGRLRQTYGPCKTHIWRHFSKNQEPAHQANTRPTTSQLPHYLIFPRWGHRLFTWSRPGPDERPSNPSKSSGRSSRDTRCSSPNHFPRSIRRHRSEQKGPVKPENHRPKRPHEGQFTSGSFLFLIDSIAGKPN